MRNRGRRKRRSGSDGGWARSFCKHSNVILYSIVKLDSRYISDRSSPKALLVPSLLSQKRHAVIINYPRTLSSLLLLL